MDRLCPFLCVQQLHLELEIRERELETVFATLSCCPTNSRALASDSIYRLHLCRVLYLSELLVLLMQPKPHSDRFCLTSFTAAVVESAGQRVLNTQPGSGDAFHSYSAFCWLQRCCFRQGDDITHNNERRTRRCLCFTGNCFKTWFTAQFKAENDGYGRNRWFIVSSFSLRMFFVFTQPKWHFKITAVFCRMPLDLCFNSTFSLILSSKELDFTTLIHD